MTAVPPDQHQRDLAIATTDRPVSVIAGAGTGKTTLLVERLFRLLASGAIGVGQVLVVTFTEKAAGELRARLRDRLEAARRQDPSSLVLRQALQDMDGAAISTIHAFCASVLREFARESGLSPTAQVIDPLQAEILEADLWREWLQQELERPDTPLDRAMEAGVPLSRVRELALAALANPGWEELPVTPAPGADLEGFRSLLKESLRDLLRLEEQARPPASDKLVEQIRQAEALLLQFETSPQAAWPPLLESSTFRSDRGSAPNWGSLLDEARAHIARLRDAREQALETHEYEAVASLIPLAWDYVRYGRQRRRALGLLSFDDLLAETDRLLRSEPHVRQRLRHRFRAVMVDEFQDTDPLQARILETLACPSDDQPPLRLFVVGDPKQSIYRFRQADLKIYRAVTGGLVAAGGVEAVITHNFRSVPGVVNWVNAAGDHLFGPQPGEAYQAPYVAIQAARPEAGTPAVWLLEPSSTEGRSHSGEIRDTEATHIAGVILRGIGNWAIDDGGQSRPATAGDITILVPTRTGIPHLVRALEGAGLATVVESAAGFFAQDEVGELISLLRAVDSPFNSVAVVAALRSSSLACTDDDLAAWAMTGSRPWDYRALRPDATGPVADGLRLLHRLHRERHGISLGAALDRILEATGLRVRMAALRGHLQPVANLDRLRDLARAYEDRRGSSLTGLARWLEERRLDDSHMADEGARLDIENLDAVRIMTIHGAKGLEFPVTVLAGLCTRMSVRGRAAIHRYQDHLVPYVPRLDRLKTARPVVEALAAEEVQSDAELRRLLYVAATRARDVLVVSLHGLPADPGDGTRPAKVYGGPLAPMRAWAGPSLVRDPAPAGPAPAPPPVRRGDEPVPADRADRIRLRTAIVAAAARPLPRVTASGFQSHEEPETLPSAIAAESRETAARRGELFHLVMERLDLAALPDIPAFVEEVAALNGAPEAADPGLEEEVAAMVRQFLGTPWPGRITSARRSWRELPFSLALDGVIVTGAVDVVLEEAGGDLVVVDYKTDRAGRGAARHAVQGGIYALALQQVTGRTPREVAFYFARSGETEILPVTASLLDLARQRILAAGNRGASQARLGLEHD